MRQLRLAIGAGTTAPRPAEDFAEAKVGQLDVTVALDQDVVGLEVAVDDVVAMEEVESHQDLRRVKLCIRLVESSHAAQPGENLAWNFSKIKFFT